MGKKTFLRGAAILGIAGLLVQVMGAVFRIPLGNIIGDDGMSYYQTAYPFYVFLLVFSTNGAPAAISKMTSERIALGQHEEAHRVFKLSFILMAVLGVVAASAIYFGAPFILQLVKSPAGAYHSIVAIAPALLFVPIMAVFRGYFQGLQQMEPTALSQLVEQAVRVAIGLTLAVLFLPRGIEYAAAGASLGTSVGPIAGVLALMLIYVLKKDKIFANLIKERARENVPQGEKRRESAGSIIKTLAGIALPITIGVSILPIMNLVDVLVVMGRLQDIGYTKQAAGALYGQFSGFAGPVINIPMALALSIALSLVPAIAAANSTKDTEFLATNVRLGLRTAMIIGIPCTFGLMALAKPIMMLLYPMQIESAESSAACLFILAIGVVFLSVAQTMVGILQGMGRAYTAVAGLGIGVVVKWVATYALAGIPAVNIQGAAWGSTIAYGVIGICNFYAVKKVTGVQFDLKLSVLKPLLSGIVMCICVLLSYTLFLQLLGGKLATVIAIVIGASVYGIMLLKTKSIAPREIELLPKGKKLAGLLRKLKLI